MKEKPKRKQTTLTIEIETKRQELVLENYLYQ